MANLNFVFTIIIYFVGRKGTTAQGSQMVNNFFNQLSEQSMNMQGMSSMNKLPSVITMGKNCGMNSGINNGMPNSAIQNSGIPNSYMNPSGANMNRPRVNSVYIGASGQCPCMMTVNSIGCPTCDCKQQGKGNQVDSIVEQKPIATEKDDIQTTAATVVSTTTLSRVLLSSTLIHRQNDTSSNKIFTTLFTTKGSTNAPQTKSNIQSHFKGMHNGPTTISDDALTSPIVFVQNKTFDGPGVVNQRQYRQHDLFTGEHSFPMAIAFGSAFIVVFVVASIFFCLWRSAARQLKHEQNELYFAEKSIRQGSVVSQIQNEMLSRKEDSVFSKVQPLDSLPELPARPKSPLTPTAPPFQLTPVKQTSFEFPQEESKHDYLELI